MGNKDRGGLGWKVGTVGLIIFLIAITNAVGYVGNALTDPDNQWIWWVITAIVVIITGIVESMERR